MARTTMWAAALLLGVASSATCPSPASMTPKGWDFSYVNDCANTKYSGNVGSGILDAAAPYDVAVFYFGWHR